MKRRTFIKLTSFVLALLMIISLFPLGVLATAFTKEEIENESEVSKDYSDIFEELIGDVYDVSSSDELEAALNGGASLIRVISDFALDRTFYITQDVAIYSTEAHTLTRSKDFGGDIFVIGEDKDGTLTENEVTLTLGDPASSVNDLLTIDGNKDNMTVSVVGSVLFVTKQGIVNVFSNTTIKNNLKVGNEKTNGDYGVSYPLRVGGSVAIVAASAEMNIYGGKFISNAVNTVADADYTSTQGGAFYNFGALNIYGGTFDSNTALFGGAFFNYRKLYIYRGVISNNVAADIGGAIYSPNSTGAFTYIGEENDIAGSAVTFDSNTAKDVGGAIYARNHISIKNAVFNNNTASSNGGAIFAQTIRMSVSDSFFTGNTATTNGGAIYVSGTNGKDDVLELTVNNTLFEENKAKNGGALYASTDSRVYMQDCEILSNTATNGGAGIYASGSTVEVNKATVSYNTSTGSGGAFYLDSSATVILNEISATENKGANGGALYSTSSDLKVYNSVFSKNTATKQGGAMYLAAGANSDFYNVKFKENHATTQSGAITSYTNGGITNFYSCEFDGNVAESYGGAMYISGASIVNMYSTIATNNKGSNGGFLYITTTGTVVTIAGLTLSGNTATTSAPIIWGNSTGAKLYLDKTKYVDLDNSSDWDDTYWSNAIVNKLKVYYQNISVPSYVDYDSTVVFPVVPIVSANVKSSAELERALNAGIAEIYISADFIIDRTFYITYDVTIHANEKHTLTRSQEFGGDIFVVGEFNDGTLCEGEVTLSLGKSDVKDNDLLIIDGNKDNMTVPVVGSVIFVTKQGIADIYPSVTIQNNLKVGNEKTNGDYGVSYPLRVGGSVAIIAASAEMNVYGGNFISNSVNLVADSETTSTQGGVFYNFGLLNIYGGTFDSNSAYFGGAFFNYRKMYIYNAVIKNNSASELGGAIYMPNSTGAFTYIGEENEVVEPNVSFIGNTSSDLGGAIYARNYILIKNATFEANKSTSAKGGGAIAALSLRMTIENSYFKDNYSAKYGGAIYLSGENGREEKEANIYNSIFENNSSVTYGGAIYLVEDAEMYALNTRFEKNSSNYGGAIYSASGKFEMNHAEFDQNTANNNGGAIYINDSSYALLNDITATSNSAINGGVIYTTTSELNMYNSSMKQNQASAASGVIYISTDSTTKIYSTEFIGNTSAKNAGAITITTGSNRPETLLHSCTFDSNTSTNFGGALHITGQGQVTMYNTVAKNNQSLYGGFMYETTAGTIVNVAGLTVSGNTADNGPIIWGNTLNAKMFIDKDAYVDLDHTGEYDTAYWAAAIKNKLTVSDSDFEVPKYLDYGNEPYDHMSDAIDVSNADELEAAILSGAKHIRIVADFEIDRTFYIISDVTIFSTINRTLTRAKGFGGDIFVVGEDSDGTSALLLGTGAKLTLGNPLSINENYLTIDGNKGNMEVDVYGTVIFICNGSKVNLYDNVTITNCKKVANEKTLDEKYGHSSPTRVGGPVCIVSNGSTLNVYGGTYSNNEAKVDIVDDEIGEIGRWSTNGGAIYNRGVFNMYGGTFSYNFAPRGGFVYNYGILIITGGTIEGNSSSAAGGAIYTPNTATARNIIGSSLDGLDKVIFKNNVAGSNGGAIYSSHMSAFIVYGNTEFIGNISLSSGGAINSYGPTTIRNTIFKDNIAANRGGAVYVSFSVADGIARFVDISGCTFENNQATLGGALQLYSGSADFETGTIVTLTDCVFNENKAIGSSAAGGAIHMDRKSKLTVYNSTFTGNTSEGEGGMLYAINECVINIYDSEITGSYSKKAGGAISARSVKINLNNTTVSNSLAEGNGGAIYVSYTSARDVNTSLSLNGCTFEANASLGYGGAIYATRHAITNEHRVLDIRNTEFKLNTAESSGGALSIASGTQVYIKDASFTSNKANSDGGALFSAGGDIEIDNAQFTENAARAGGAVFVESNANLVMNEINASGNTSSSTGAFMYIEKATLKLYNSEIKNNQTVANAGGIAFYSGAVADIYNTVFEGNVSGANGGALTVYTDGTKVTLNGCTFTANQGANGGAIYVSGKSLLELYNTVSTQNTAAKGGFMYETTTGTEVTIVGITVDSNTATDGGNIIWGNSTGAKLFINKNKYTDKNTDTLNSEYWNNAIYNELKVSEITTAAPSYKDYVPEAEEEIVTPPAKEPVPVDPIFQLGISSSDEYINSTYDKFPVLDNSSNFMSKGETYFENINGETVTVDSFIYPPRAAADNINFGQGMLIYQAMLYKQANPDEDVYIDISSYRFSVQSALNINRNSRYFGYMRQLSGIDYDKYGFVRIAYLLVCAAKMGIYVNVIGHTDAYPVTASDRDLYTYFTSQLNDPCDPAYVNSNMVVDDYMDFTKIDWTLSEDEKGGTDMMHTKLCAVSHYLDMNGEIHKNAVWTSSSNLDGTLSSGANANWKLQTATIVSDHEEIYKVSVNYLRLMAKYAGQEEIYEFQDIMNRVSTEQAKLILEGKGDQIPDDEQLIYLGTENDNVFELYFTPFGGDILTWDEVNNPYCKYIRKMYNSEGPIAFAWNAAEYSGGFQLAKQLEDMIVESFYKNKDKNNKFYGIMETFDGSRLDDLIVGIDIGYKSVNNRYFGEIHNKDVHVSYVENGQRYYVSILNSLNLHAGSMYYQSNFALVIKETSCSPDSVYATITRNSVECDMTYHDYSEDVKIKDATETEHGYKYKSCNGCGIELRLDTVHNMCDDWKVVKEATPTEKGIRYKDCTVCSLVLSVEKTTCDVLIDEEPEEETGMTFTQNEINLIGELSDTPHTFEALIQFNGNYTERAGVVVGNYYGKEADNVVNIEIYERGRVRLFYISGGERVDCIFTTGIGYNKMQHIAVTIDGNTASLYINGEFAESQKLSATLPETTEGFSIGGDSRPNNEQYFKGSIYSLNMFSDVRTADEIAYDAKNTIKEDESLVFSKYYVTNAIPSFENSGEGVSPKTFEATVLVPKKTIGRVGVIVGNYYGVDSNNVINVEVYENGRVRLFYITNGQRVDCIFNTDIRSNESQHIAISVDGTTALFYLNGELIETKEVAYELPNSSENFVVGKDLRGENCPIFNGTIYSVSMFSDIRSADEIKSDATYVSKDTEGLIYSKYFTNNDKTSFIESNSEAGVTFDSDKIIGIGNVLSATPHTFEATIQVDKTLSDRAGVVVSNYGIDPNNAISIEIYQGGLIRLFYINNGQRVDCIFGTDIRSDKPVHIAVTVDGTTASLFVNGEYKESKSLSASLPNSTSNYAIGSDYRAGNSQYFKGTIYSVNLFSDVRTQDEIKQDMAIVTRNEEGLLHSSYACDDGSFSPNYGQTFTADAMSLTPCYLGATPYTFEALIQVDKDFNDRPGAIISNYGVDLNNAISLEIYQGGVVRLFYINNGQRVYCHFATDIRSDKPVHIAVTFENMVASLYVNGEFAESKTLEADLPNCASDFIIGGDNREGNTQYFKGIIYSVNLFSDVRTQEEIKNDIISVSGADSLLHSANFISKDTIFSNETSIHKESGAIIDKLPSEGTVGVSHTECIWCGKYINVYQFSNNYKKEILLDLGEGTGLEEGKIISLDTLAKAPKTFEFAIQLSSDYNERAGVLFGNYDGSNKAQFNIEVYEKGVIRLFYKLNGYSYSFYFTTDIRSNSVNYVAITLDKNVASLYLNGEYKESIAIDLTAPTILSGFCVGGDARTGIIQDFKGKLYGVNIFSDVRSENEIALDRLFVEGNEDGLIYSNYFLESNN